MPSKKGPVVKVRKEKGQEILEKLKEEGRLDGSRVIEEEGDELIIPVHCGTREKVLKKREVRQNPFRKIKDEIDLQEELKVKLPSRWEMIGEILLIKLPKELEPWKGYIGKVYAEVLGMKSVLIQGNIKGTKREPEVELIYGEEMETVHLENDIKFKLDLSELMFSSGNIDERIRMAGVPEREETVVDMFSGIGYFTLPMAVHSEPEKIYSLEINDTAYEYLKKNIELNDVQNIVTPWKGDNRDFPKKDIADRIVMGYLHDTHRFLPKALELLKEQGVIHYHTRVADQEFPDKVEREISNDIRDEHEIIEIHKIKSYAPHVYHVVADIKVR